MKNINDIVINKADGLLVVLTVGVDALPLDGLSAIERQITPFDRRHLTKP